jgi:hypothetical protein
MSALFFLASLLSAMLAVATAAIISFGNDASQFIGHLTRKMGPGIIHPDKPASYRLVYLFVTLAVVFVGAGIYYWGQ